MSSHWAEGSRFFYRVHTAKSCECTWSTVGALFILRKHMVMFLHITKQSRELSKELFFFKMLFLKTYQNFDL